MKKQKQKKEKQLKFGLRNTPKNIYFKYKDQYELWLAGLETRKYIKDPFTWFAIILSISFILTEIYMIETQYKIPSRIPILNYYVNPLERLTIKEIIYIYPILSSIILIITIILSNKYYHKERDLSKTLLLVTFLTNFSLCLLFLKLLNIF